MDEKPKHAGGRPATYRPTYCQLLIAMYNKPSTRRGKKTYTTKNGTVIEEDIELPNKPTHVVDFCDKVHITTKTFYEWVKKYPEFSEAYAHAKSYLERNITDNALLNNYNAGFASLVSKNWLGWKEKTELSNDPEHPLPNQQTTLIVANGNLSGALQTLVDIGAVKVNTN
jgi:hypothetical protein